MDPVALRGPSPAGQLPAPTASAAPEAAGPAMDGDRYVGARAAGPDAFASLSAGQKAWRGFKLALRALPGEAKGLLSHPGQLVAPYTHPVRSLKEAAQGVAAASKEGPVEGALAALKGYGGLIAAWGLPLSLAIAPFTGGASLVATAMVAAGTLGLGATGASLVKNTVDASKATTEAELDTQSRQMAEDGLGLLTAAATAGVGKAVRGATPHARASRVEAPAAEPTAPRADRRRAKQQPDAQPQASQATAPVEAPAKPKAIAPTEPKPAPIEPVVASKPDMAAKADVDAKPAAEASAPQAAEPVKPVVARPEGIVRKPLAEHPPAMERAVADGANFYSPVKVNYTAQLFEDAGYDGLPSIGTIADVDAAVAQGATELYRGVSDIAYADQFRDGALYTGMANANGSGAWAGIGEAGRLVAAKYGQGRGTVMRMALKPEAKVVSYEALTKMLKEEKAASVATINQARADLKAAVEAAATPEEAARLKSEGNAAISQEAIRSGFTFQDLGRYGALKGYDAIRADSTGFVNVLNRTALLVQDTDASRSMRPLA